MTVLLMENRANRGRQEVEPDNTERLILGSGPLTLWEFISRLILSGVTKHAAPSQAASTVTPTVGGPRGSRLQSQHTPRTQILENRQI